jgi:hypothetical protein
VTRLRARGSGVLFLAGSRYVLSGVLFLAGSRYVLSGVLLLAGSRYVLFSKTSRLALQLIWPPIQQILALDVKWLECDAHHSIPSSDEIRKEWSYTSVPLYVHAMHRKALPLLLHFPVLK